MINANDGIQLFKNQSNDKNIEKGTAFWKQIKFYLPNDWNEKAQAHKFPKGGQKWTNSMLLEATKKKKNTEKFINREMF